MHSGVSMSKLNGVLVFHCTTILHLHTSPMTIQWNLSSTDTLGTKIIVLISEVSIFQERITRIYMKLGLGQVSWLTRRDGYNFTLFRNQFPYIYRKGFV